MPRVARRTRAWVIYHLTNKAFPGLNPFRDYSDVRNFVRLMRDAAQRSPVRLLAWRLNRSHYELAVVPEEEGSLGQWMGRLATAYTALYRVRYGGSGPLWRGRYRSVPVQPGVPLDLLLLHMFSTPEEDSTTRWPWAYLAESEVRRFGGLTGVIPLKLVNHASVGGEIMLRSTVSAGLPIAAGLEFVVHCLRSGCPLGDMDWIRAIDLDAGHPSPVTAES